jgi:Zn-dependent alcohol dehydrogenase
VSHAAAGSAKSRRRSSPSEEFDVSDQLSLTDINKGFELMRAGESIRSVVVY